MGTESEPLNTEKTVRLYGRSTNTGRLMPVVLLAVAVGMQVMFFLFAAGAPVWLVLPALLATLFAVMAPFLRHINLSLEADGIQVDMRPMYKFGNWPATKSFRLLWSDIAHYEIGSDLNRALVEKRFLTIQPRKGNTRIRITENENEREGFTVFSEALESRIRQWNAMHGDAGEDKHQHSPDFQPIRKKPGFYTSFFGKALTLLFLFLTSLVGAIMVSQGLGSGGSWFKLLFILIPGTAYMVYRSFIRKDPS
jgi:hypothetical protein